MKRLLHKLYLMYVPIHLGPPRCLRNGRSRGPAAGPYFGAVVDTYTVPEPPVSAVGTNVLDVEVIQPEQVAYT